MRLQSVLAEESSASEQSLDEIHQHQLELYIQEEFSDTHEDQMESDGSDGNICDEDL